MQSRRPNGQLQQSIHAKIPSSRARNTSGQLQQSNHSEASSSRTPTDNTKSFSAPPEESNIQLTVHRFNQLFPLPSFMRGNNPIEPLGDRLKDLFQTALTLSRAGEAFRRNTVSRIASEEGLSTLR